MVGWDSLLPLILKPNLLAGFSMLALVQVSGLLILVMSIQMPMLSASTSHRFNRACKRLGFLQWRKNYRQLLTLSFHYSTPPNVHFQIDDLEDEWTFSQPFDYIHVRAMSGSIKNWSAFLERCIE